MPALLHLQVSPKNAESVSRRIGADYAARLAAADPGMKIVTRDLGLEPLPPLDSAFALASLAHLNGAAETPAALTLSEALLGELETAARIVISTPMHNFTVPAALKLWIDYVVRPNRSFAIKPAGKVGLLADKPVEVIVACGGGFTGSAGTQADFFSDYLRYVLGTIGLKSVEILRLENVIRRRDEAAAKAEQWMMERVG